MRTRSLSLVILTALLGGTVWAQSPVHAMPVDANPGFEVATIKPGNPDTPGKDFGFEGRIFYARNYNVNDIIALAYGLHPNAVLNAPHWFSSELYDIEGVPDVEGVPDQRQKTRMMQELLRDRFHLAFHLQKKRLPVYAITVAQGGPRLTASDFGANDPERYRFMGRLDTLDIRNMTLAEFAIWFQKTVTDKPVVDQSGLTGRYDFTLNWTPDGSQFLQLRGAGTFPPRPRDDPHAPPELSKAFQQQLGLRFQPAKALVDVMVVDHADKPSSN